MFEPVQHVRAYERVVQQIEDAIHTGDLQPGQRLPSERALMQQFAVSRSTVREALRVLQSSGLVQSRPGDPHGALVLPFSSVGLHKSLTSLARVEHLSLGELVQFRMLVEGAENRLAAHRRTPEQLDMMENAMERMRAAVGSDHDTFSRADLAFHEAVATSAANKLLQTCNRVVRDVVLGLIADKIAHAPDSAALMQDSVRRHDLVLDAVRDGDGARAQRLAHKHLYEYYAGHLDEAERPHAEALIDTPAHGEVGRL